MEATVQAKSLDKGLKITLAGSLYLASPQSLLNEACVFIQIPCSQGGEKKSQLASALGCGALTLACSIET